MGKNGSKSGWDETALVLWDRGNNPNLRVIPVTRPVNDFDCTRGLEYSQEALIRLQFLKLT